MASIPRTIKVKINIGDSLRAKIKSQDPCDTCDFDAICDTFGYKATCTDYQDYLKGGCHETNDQSMCDRTCINCCHFKTFAGACEVHEGPKENHSTCGDFEPIGGDNCKVKGCSCK